MRDVGACRQAHVCIVPPVVPAEVLSTEATDGSEVSANTKLGVSNPLQQIFAAVLNVATFAVPRDRASFTPPVPCTLLKRLPGETDELDAAGRVIYRVEPK